MSHQKIAAHYGWRLGAGLITLATNDWVSPSDRVRHDAMKNVNVEVKLRIIRVASPQPNELIYHRTTEKEHQVEEGEKKKFTSVSEMLILCVQSSYKSYT